MAIMAARTIMEVLTITGLAITIITIDAITIGVIKG